METLGLVYHFREKRLRHRPARVWRLYLATRGPLRRRRTSSKIVEIWLGHVVSAFQLNPECLAILSVVYKFVKGGFRSECIWLGLRKEMRTVMGVLFLLEVNLGAEFSQDVYSRDSSGLGFAVHVTKGAPGELREAWRWREKWRYRRVFEVPELPLEIDLNNLYVEGGHPRAGLSSATAVWRRLLEEGSSRAVLRGGRKDEGEEVLVAGSVPPLETRWTPRSRYRLVARGQWALASEHINMKEGRVALAGVRRQCRSVKGVGRRAFTLSDNLACI